MALFRVSNERAQFDAAGTDASDQYGAGIRFTQGGNARVTTGSATNYNQGIPMSGTGQVAIVDATAGLPVDTIYHNGLPMSGDKVCVSRNATAVVSNGTPYDSAGAVAADINLDLNFIGTDTLNYSVTFTRASSATFVGSNGLIQSATTNTPRFDYDPVTLAAKGLLIEEQRTNLLTRSEDFGNATWAKTTCTVSTDATTSPAGDSTADKLIPDVGVTTYNIIQGSISKAAVATTYTYTIYVKDGGFQSFTLYINDNAATANRVQASFNISTVTTSSVSAAGTFTAASASLAAVGNGWYRCVLTGTSSTETSIQVRLLHGTGTGDGTSGLFIWGAQLEAGSFATSYIPTAASQVTRSADVASVNTLSPWFNASSGSFYAEADITGAPNNNRVFEMHDGTENNRLLIYNTTFSTKFFGSSAGTGTEATAASSIPTSGVPFKVAGAFTAGEYAISYNGGTVATAAPAALPIGLSAMVLGARRTGQSPLNGHLRRLTFYPRRLSNAELQAITA